MAKYYEYPSWDQDDAPAVEPKVGNPIYTEDIPRGFGLGRAPPPLAARLRASTSPAARPRPSGAADRSFDVIFRVRHHAEHVALVADDSGNGVDRRRCWFKFGSIIASGEE